MKTLIRAIIYIGGTFVLIALLYLPLFPIPLKEELELPFWEKAAVVVLESNQATGSLTEETSVETEVEVNDHQEDEPFSEEEDNPPPVIEDDPHEVFEPTVLQALEGYYQIDENIQPPIFDVELLQSRLKYPSLAKRQAQEGTVVMRLFISSSGMIERVLIEEDPGYGFAAAVVAAFEGLQVVPAFSDGLPIAVTMLYPIRFTLR